jgi:hypothetical protein
MKLFRLLFDSLFGERVLTILNGCSANTPDVVLASDRVKAFVCDGYDSKYKSLAQSQFIYQTLEILLTNQKSD